MASRRHESLPPEMRLMESDMWLHHACFLPCMLSRSRMPRDTSLTHD